MKIDLFDVEAWMTEYETNYRYNLAETCVASMSINDLLEFVENKKGVIDNLLNTKLDYGPIVGSQRLREGTLTPVLPLLSMFQIQWTFLLILHRRNSTIPEIF